MIMMSYLTALLFLFAPIQGLPLLPATALGLFGMLALLRFKTISEKTLFVLLILNYVFWGLNLIVNHSIDELLSNDFIRWQLRGFFGFLPLLGWLTVKERITESKIKFLTFSLLIPATAVAMMGVSILIFNVKIPELTTDIEFSLFPLRKVVGEVWFFGMHRSRLAAAGFYLTVVTLLTCILCFSPSKKYIYLFLSSALLINLWALSCTKARTYMLGYLISLLIIIIVAFCTKSWRIIRKTLIISLSTIVVLVLFILITPFSMERFLESIPQTDVSQQQQPASGLPSMQDTKSPPVTPNNIIAQYNVFDRIVYWKGAIEMIREHPIKGVGLGNFTKEFRKRGELLKIIPIKEQMMHAHNSYLHITAELGLIGIVLFLSFWGGVAWKVKGHLKNCLDSPFKLALVACALAVVGGQSFAALVDYNFWSPSIMIPITALLGVVLNIMRPVGKEPSV